MYRIFACLSGFLTKLKHLWFFNVQRPNSHQQHVHVAIHYQQ